MFYANHVRILFSCLAVILLWFMAVSARAHEHEADVPFENIGNKILTGHEEEGGGFHPHYVFQKRFNDSSDWPNGVEMCFNSEASVWPTNYAIGLTILDALRKWNGSDFSVIPTEQVVISYAQGSNIFSLITPSTPGSVSGLERFPNSSGIWHKHFNFELTAPFSDGIYLLQMELYSTDPTITKSDPFFFVLRQDEIPGGDGSLEEWNLAAAWVENHMVPEPGTFALLVLGLVAGGLKIWWKRRQTSVTTP